LAWIFFQLGFERLPRDVLITAQVGGPLSGDIVAKLGEGWRARNNRIAAKGFLNQSCGLVAILESILPAQTPKIVHCRGKADAHGALTASVANDTQQSQGTELPVQHSNPAQSVTLIALVIGDFDWTLQRRSQSKG
jgi:hypothetical protein